MAGGVAGAVVGWGRALGSGPVVAVGLATVLGMVWVRYLADAGGDMAAQFAWARFVARHPGSADDLAWYGGAYPAAYSLAAPALMAAVGVRAAAVAALVASSALLALLVRRSGVRWPWLVSGWGAFALWCDVAAGRVAFAVGLAGALAALALLTGTRAEVDGGRPGPGRVAAGAVAAGLATAASPLAGLFLEVAAAALLLTRRPRAGWALAVPPVLVVASAALLFPSYGVDPISAGTVVATLACTAAVALLVPPRWRALRIAALAYALGAVASCVAATPIGGNIGRLALVLTSVPLLAALTAPRPPGRRGRARTAALLVAFATTAYWLVAADLVGLPPAIPAAADTTALTAELRGLHADRARVEAVPMVNHWEAWGLADTVELARGWNRQLDLQRNPLFYDGALTAADYHGWLRRWAVRYVVLAADPPDEAAQAETDVIRARPPWLRLVWQTDRWRLYEVTDAEPLAAPPARTLTADAAEVVVTAPVVTVRLRVPWSPWLAVTGPGPACLARDGDWTALRVRTPGTYRVTAPYAWPRGTPCPQTVRAVGAGRSTP